MIEQVEVKTETQPSSFHNEVVLTVNDYGYIVFDKHVPQGHPYIETDEIARIFKKYEPKKD